MNKIDPGMPVTPQQAKYQKKVLILGIGNFLMGDEGVGVHLANYLADEPLPDQVEVLDGGTGGFHLTSIIESNEVVIMVDATLDGRVPGTIRLLEPRFAKDYPRAMSTHDIGMKDLIDSMILMDTLPKVYLFAVSIETLQQQQVTLSPVIKDVLPILKKQILELTSEVLVPDKPMA